MPGPPKSKSEPRSRWGALRTLRIIISVFVLVVLFLSFTDFRHQIPNIWGHRLAEIQFIPALNSTLSGVVWPAAVILAALIAGTLVFGRVYCSFICPLGIFQDFLSRLGRLFKSKKSKFLRYAPPVKWIRSIMLGIVALAFLLGLQAYVISWLDPYSQFGRMANMFFNPVLAEINNALVGKISGLFTVLPEWPREVFWLLVPVLLLLGIMTVFALKRGRLYCNTICPVGAFLGILSRISAFRVTFDKNSCTKCARCMKACKSQCIDLRKSEIDYSRCVNCFDCTVACDERGLRYRFTWKKDKPLSSVDSTLEKQPSHKEKIPSPQAVSEALQYPYPKPSEDVMGHLPKSDRRTFMGLSLLGIWATLTGCAEKKEATRQEVRSRSVSKAISPAGSVSVSRFLDYCTACHLCLDACPTKTLRPAYMEYGARGFLKPHLTFEEGFCNFDCTDCADVCPTGAILPIALDLKKKTRIAVARFTKEECIVAFDKRDCGACSEHCPTQALSMVPIGEELRQPHWINDACARCGECYKVCKYGAITQIQDPQYPDVLRPIYDWDKCVGCGECKNVCEAGAIELKPAQYSVTIPRLDPTLCIGCGACECACPEKAVVVEAIPVHEEARVHIEEKVVNPNEGVDFPF